MDSRSEKDDMNYPWGKKRWLAVGSYLTDSSTASLKLFNTCKTYVLSRYTKCYESTN